MKLKNIIFFLLLLLLATTSCKKDKLKDDKQNLIGKWNWTRTIYLGGWCTVDQWNNVNYELYQETITADTINKNYSVEFLKKGKVLFFEDGIETEKGRIVFNYFEPTADGAYVFYFYLNNDKEKGFGGTLNADTLTFDYPFMEDDPACENYLNFLIRE